MTRNDNGGTMESTYHKIPISYNGNGRASYYRKFCGDGEATKPRVSYKPPPPSLATYIDTHGYIELDWRLRDGLLKLVYKGGRVVVVEV